MRNRQPTFNTSSDCEGDNTVRVLIVDDSRTVRAIIGRTIKELGFEVFEASNGREALKKLAEIGKVELGLVDWNMPEMTGIEFVSAVRSQPNYNSMKLMMVTTGADLAHVSKALDAGADEYLMKPFTKDMIVSKLEIMGLVQD